MKTPTYFQPDPSFTSLSYTYSFSKYSCVAWVYPLHIIFAYLVVLTGIFAMLSRVVERLKPYHKVFGTWYLIFMFWCMASSLLIYTNGLPFPIIVSFVYLLVSLTVGLNAIRGHTTKLRKQIYSRISHKLSSRPYSSNYDPQPLDLQKLQAQQRTTILKQKTFTQRLFSYKMLHGIFMSFSWYQLAGRLMVTNPFTSFNGCWTYPAYKSGAMSEMVYPVDGVSTPAFPMEESKFLAIITIPAVVTVLLVAVGTTYWFYKVDQKGKKEENSQSTLSSKLTSNS